MWTEGLLGHGIGEGVGRFSDLSSRGMEKRMGMLTAAWLLPSTSSKQLLGLGTGRPMS